MQTHSVRTFKSILRSRLIIFAALPAQSICMLLQVESAKVVGALRDATGAVLSGAKITITNTNTKLSRTAITDASGDYVVTELPRKFPHCTEIPCSIIRS